MSVPDDPGAGAGEPRFGAPPDVRTLVRLALAEDVGSGDWTTAWTLPPERAAAARVLAKTRGTVFGLAVARAVFAAVNPALTVEEVVSEGAAVQPAQLLLRVEGSARSILTAERTALNFLQRLSGVATLTRAYADAVAGTGATILDTRKTTPGMRALEKQAVRAGGGANHRFGLHDMVLIKENHIAAAGGIRSAVEAVRRRNRLGLRVEVEATSLDEVEEAVAAGVDRILFDNMPLPVLAAAVRTVQSAGAERIETEASGGIDLTTVRAVAETGVDFVSVGALTHSAPALDLSLLIEPP